jgi:hypothetical protein
LIGFLKYHFFAFVCALFISFFIAIFVIKLPILNQVQAKNKIISGNKTSYSGLYENLKANENLELELKGSLEEKNGISLFGSSELANYSNYIPYHFLPDSMGIRVNAFGHAFQQNLAVYTQLLLLKIA